MSFPKRDQEVQAFPSDRLSLATGMHSASVGGGMSFALYLIGFIVLIAGLAFGANMMHVRQVGKTPW